MSLKDKEARKIYNREYHKKYYPQNKERIKKYQQEYYKKRGKTNYDLFGKDWYQRNKDKNANRSKQWAQRNRKRMVEIVLKSREKNKEKFNNYQNRFNKTIEGRFRYYRYGAKRKKHELNLSIENFGKIISQPCIYCGESEKPRGIDRVDNSLGYTKENSVPCCKTCNYMKRSLTKQEFLNHINKIYKFNKTK